MSARARAPLLPLESEQFNRSNNDKMTTTAAAAAVTAAISKRASTAIKHNKHPYADKRGHSRTTDSHSRTGEQTKQEKNMEELKKK